MSQTTAPITEETIKVSPESSTINSSEKPAEKAAEEIKMEQEKPLTASFVYMENVADILKTGYATGKNVILFGPGGFGKSEYSEAFFNEKGIDPYIFTMGSGTTTDRLFGGLDIPTFNSTGKIEYLIENSFMNHEYVIFEELFDAPDFILEQLKDILSSGMFRNGSQKFEIKTKLIVCCTNRTREEFSKNNSLRALMERFPLEAEVKWKDHTRVNYEHLLKSRFGGCNPFIPYVLEAYNKAGVKISPRIAIVAAEIAEECGIEALAHVAELNKKPEILKESVTKFKGMLEIEKLGTELQTQATALMTASLNTLEGLKASQTLLRKFKTALAKLKSTKADDSVVGRVTEMIKTYDKVAVEMTNKITTALAMEDDLSLDDQSPVNFEQSITLDKESYNE